MKQPNIRYLYGCCHTVLAYGKPIQPAELYKFNIIKQTVSHETTQPGNTRVADNFADRAIKSNYEMKVSPAAEVETIAASQMCKFISTNC